MTGIIAQNVGRTSGLIKAASGGTSTGAWTKIKTLTASSDATLSFVDGTDDVVLDSTYPIYVFKFINIHPETDDQSFQVNFRDGGSAYDATKTTTYFDATHGEDGGSAVLNYETGHDLAQSTGSQFLSEGISNDADHGSSGTLHLYNPSDTTFVKHFICRSNGTRHSDISSDVFVAGYCNVTAAIDGVQFSMSSDNIDSGVIKLYGLKDSA
jgi:hypothetical protein|tara:strand:- start:22 stop:654 length:633 start_codon:yes stop_codon:yes gene_type:complete